MTKNKNYNSVSLLCVNNKKKKIKGDQIGREFSKYTNRNNCLESFNLTYQLTSCSCLFCMYNKASLYWDISCFLSPYGCCEALDGKMHGFMIYEIGVCFFYLYWCGFWSKPFFSLHCSCKHIPPTQNLDAHMCWNSFLSLSFFTTLCMQGRQY